jgi:hypothetical protein
MSDGSYLPLGEFVPGVPKSLEALIYQLLQFNPAQRVASARALADRLAEAEHGAQRDLGETLDIELDIIEHIAD